VLVGSLPSTPPLTFLLVTRADGYRIIVSTSPYYQVASTFDLQEILHDWVSSIVITTPTPADFRRAHTRARAQGWIEEHLMPLAERMEGRDFRILAVKYFSGAPETLACGAV
jgi:hypothetical protein